MAQYHEMWITHIAKKYVLKQRSKITMGQKGYEKCNKSARMAQPNKQ